jgi:hypothetical protein
MDSLYLRRKPACLINPAVCSCGAMAVVDQKRPCVGMLETFARFLGHYRSVSARMSGLPVTDGNTDSL